jgi:hypothetical protein
MSSQNQGRSRNVHTAVPERLQARFGQGLCGERPQERLLVQAEGVHARKPEHLHGYSGELQASR